MATDYESIRQKNRQEYGKSGAAKIGKLTSELLYADRTHFIYELLQNAEDALGRRGRSQNRSHRVVLTLSEDRFRVKHCGAPFTPEDVRAICDFGESTKQDDITEIGRFGIGFKSVYAYTSEPRIHSGDEHFAISDYIYPKEIRQHEVSAANQDESPVTSWTVFTLPFNEDDPAEAVQEIEAGLRQLHPRTLLFLRHIREISWYTHRGESGYYRRKSERVAEDVHRVSLISKKVGLLSGADASTEKWLVFSRSMKHQEKPAGEVQIAFFLDNANTDNISELSIRKVDDCKLYARFETGLETHLGLLIDGPYRTTLNREGIPTDDSWNKHCIDETAQLLVKSLRWLRDKDMLTGPGTAMFTSNWSLYKIHDNLYYGRSSKKLAKRLTPNNYYRAGIGGYISAKFALIRQSGPLQELFSSEQLAVLYGDGYDWLEDSLWRDDHIRNFLREELDMREVLPDTILLKATERFFERQSNKWLEKLYIFLH